MKLKIISAIVGLLSLATIGVVQLNVQAALPGTVGNAPRCTVVSVGERGSAFNLGANPAPVTFTVSGGKNCKVRLSTGSFYAPSMDGRPYNKQILFHRNIRVFDKPGTYTMYAPLPTSSTPAQGCYYQVDLSYGTVVNTPVIAYGHGQIPGCGKQPVEETPAPKPTAECVATQATAADTTQTKYNLTTQANATNGATINSYSYVVTDSTGNSVAALNSTDGKATYTQVTPGTYKVAATVNTSLGPVTSAACAASFTVPVPAEPGVSITKLVDGMKYKRVAIDTVFTYQLKVTNTGNVDLTNVKVTDTAPTGVTLISADNGTITGTSWTYTIPSLAKGASQTFNLKAKVPTYVAGMLKNTACVDSPDVTGTPDGCDSANVDVPAPGKAVVCNPTDGKIITVDEKDKANYLPRDDKACNPATPAPVATELPHTGVGDAVSQIAGAVSLAAAGAYYLASRREI